MAGLGERLIDTSAVASGLWRRGAREAAAYVRERHGFVVAVSTLDKMRSSGGGPAFRRFGRLIMYEERLLDAWVAARLSRPMADTSGAAA